MKLVFVHGRDQQGKNGALLKSQWEDARAKGLAAAGLKPPPPHVEVVFPYYGDILARLVAELATPLVEGISAKGAMPDAQDAAFRGELLYELARNAGVTDADIQAEYPALPSEKGPLNWGWVQAILRVLDKTTLGDLSIDLFTRDVFVYLTNANVRKAINKVVADAVTGEPAIIVSHSLGTIIAYDVLRAPGSAVTTPLFVTLGSPLGLSSVQSRLVPPALAMPRGVKQWFNAYDKRDVVALKPLDPAHFPIQPPIQNKGDVNNHTENRHGIIGYLDDPEVARLLWDALGGIPSPFSI
jgi:hypothetical protein